mgnify:CR=1 FL=1|tara:strand:- start:62145 stop:62543 length:399 start_codon:yes stop_codon:yes gene_type:complete
MKNKLISLVCASTAVIILSGFYLFAGWSVDPTHYYFHNVPPGEFRDAQYTVYNGGPGWSGGGTVSITNSPHPEFYSCVSGCSYWIGPGEDHTVTIRYTAPCSASNSGATINFPTDSGTILGWIGASSTGSGC